VFSAIELVSSLVSLCAGFQGIVIREQSTEGEITQYVDIHDSKQAGSKECKTYGTEM
jgi:hypothetical protein